MFNLITARMNTASLMVVRVELMCGEVSLGFASAFYERMDGRKFLVTNWHCVTGREPHNGHCKSPSGITPDSVVVWNHYLAFEDTQDGSFNGRRLRISEGAPFSTPNRQKIPIEYGPDSRWRMHAAGQKVDLAAVEMAKEEAGTIDCCLSNILLEKDIQLEVGDEVVIVGFPMGLTPTGTLPIWKSGFVATEPAICADGEPCFWIDAATRQGMSGSPVFKRSRRYVRPSRTALNSPGTLSLEDPGGLSFVGVYSGRMGKIDLLEGQLGKVWVPSLVHETIVDGVALDFNEI